MQTTSYLPEKIGDNEHNPVAPLPKRKIYRSYGSLGRGRRKQQQNEINTQRYFSNSCN